jgi:hypothetical protein
MGKAEACCKKETENFVKYALTQGRGGGIAAIYFGGGGGVKEKGEEKKGEM